MRNDVTGVILAGGLSRRFGSNKALAPWGDTTILQTICHIFQSIFSNNLVVIKNKSSFPSLSLGPCRIVEDRLKNHHALGGIITALEVASTENVFISACDTPLIQPELIQVLCSRHTEALATIPVWGGKIQPLCAVYTKSALPLLQAAIERGQVKLQDALQTLNPVWISDAELRWAGISGWSFFDLDTREDYEYAKKRG